ncbi:iron ABC transporter permease [Vibrio ponticus]|uniref:Iron ABC transporter permease n=1 Tax=Vibrio ponticus TaxID=265668 RepID=A0A3N3DUM1_9VIBR|nr:iron ABC transporter permease [Vibrio ponticus]ROV57898.1 iron ABC transporter permease [Vibrio ponticus]
MNSSRSLSTKTLCIISSIALYLTTVASITVGPMDISFTDSIKSMLPISSVDTPTHIAMIIQQVRIPRTLLAISLGAILALCGAVLQGLFRNPLADPGIIGVSSGASLGAAIAIVLLGGLATHYPTLMLIGTVPLFACLGGVVVTFIVYRLGTDQNGTSVTMMLLAGIAISAAANAGLGLLNYFADDQALRDLSLWTMGSLAGANLQGIVLAFTTLFILFVCYQRDADKLNAMLLGEAEARHMGINVQRVKRRLIVLAATGVGITVSLAGIIGFVGLIVPHLARMIIGPNYKSLLPVSMLLGALLLLFADMLARTVVAPLDMPVGIVTALIGTPFFLWLLIKQKGRI